MAGIKRGQDLAHVFQRHEHELSHPFREQYYWYVQLKEPCRDELDTYLFRFRVDPVAPHAGAVKMSELFPGSGLLVQNTTGVRRL